jgi:hemolysin D
MSRALKVLRDSLSAERASSRTPRRDPGSLDFLPAVLEVTETPPSPTARVLAAVLCLFLLLSLAWSIIGRVDVVAVAEGKTMPSGRSKTVQAAEAAVVTSIHVEDGQTVAAGEILIQFDPTQTGAERERIAQALAEAQVAAARLRSLLTSGTLDAALAGFLPPADADGTLVESQRDLLVTEFRDHAAKLAEISQEARSQDAQRAQITATIRRLDLIIPLLSEAEAARHSLLESGSGSRLTWLETKHQLVDAEEERKIQSFRLAEAESVIAQTRTRGDALVADFRLTKTKELSDAERQAVSLAQELVKADRSIENMTVRAPINGKVQQLALHTVGGVVQPAQALLIVVPDDDTLEVEAKVQNRDIGFVTVGQQVELKVETFAFTRYGLLPGEVQSVSGDGVLDEKTGQVFYPARIRLLQSSMMVDGREVTLGPGMNVTVEIKTGSRRVIEYLLSPILRYNQEAIRER